MIRIRTLLLLTISTMFIGACKQEEMKSWTLVPFPNKVTVHPGSFTFDRGIAISNTDPRLDETSDFFRKKLKDLGVETNTKSSRTIHLELTDSGDAEKEAYKLDIGKKEVRVSASSPNGVFYGLMTIWQELRLSNSQEIPRGLIVDEPRFGYRGFMLDESRHFFGKEKVMQIIDLMSTLKLNTFHWHLTDAPGWRIEIKGYPKLATIGGQGDYSNPDGPMAYYTQEEIREIVNYAEERFITIIPEIDMPGHATAANRAYPEFSGGGSEKRPDFTFDPGNEETYAYLSKILKEVAELFPSKYIHLGGDEVHFGNQKWSSDKGVKSLMSREGLSTLVDVEHYFMQRMIDSVRSMGKEVAGWDEIIESEMSNKNTMIYWWRHDKEEQLQKSLARGFQTILCPRLPLYFDFVQHDSHTNGRRWDGFGKIEDVYQYPESRHQFSNEENDLVLGVQANLWTERLDTEQWIDFMTFPRLFALAESAWTNHENKDLARFTKSLPGLYNFLDQLNIYYFNSLDPSHHQEPMKQKN